MKTTIHTKNGPAALGPYSQGVVTGNLLFVSGQLALDPASGNMIDGTIADHTQKILDNIEAIAKAAGTGLDNVVKTTIFLTNLADFGEVNTAYGTRFPDNPPARSTVQVAALPLGAPIEIEAVIALSSTR